MQNYISIASIVLLMIFTGFTSTRVDSLAEMPVTTAFSSTDQEDPATVTDLKKDRTGSRFSNRWQIRTDRPKQIWRTGPLKMAIRKSYVRAGQSDLLVGRGPTPGSINDMMNGNRVLGWTTLKAGTAEEFGNTSELVFISTGPGDFYVHIEWNRNRTFLLGF